MFCRPNFGRRHGLTMSAIFLFAALGGMAWLFYAAGFEPFGEPGEAGVFAFLKLFGVSFVLYGVALWTLARVSDRLKESGCLIVVFSAAVVFRVLMVPAGMTDGFSWEKVRADMTSREVVFNRFLLYDHDVWRYLWDGNQQAAGLNPYRFAPAELEPFDSPEFETNPELEKRLFPSDPWRDVWDNINYKEIPTIYPPALQWTFRAVHAVAPGSILAWKILLLLVDLTLCAVLADVLRTLNLPTHYLALYAWNPLLIKEIEGSAHADAIPALFVACALLAYLRKREGWGSFWLGLGILAKLTPAVLVVFVWPRISWKARLIGIGTVALGFAPFLDAGGRIAQGFSTYAGEWIFNPGLFELFRWTALKLVPSVNPSTQAKVACGVLYLALIVFLLRRRERSPVDFAEKWLWALGGLVVLSSAVMPWYLTWILPLSAVCRRWSWVVFSGLCLLSYRVYIRGDGVEEAWSLAVIHGGFFLTLAWEGFRRRIKSVELG